MNNIVINNEKLHVPSLQPKKKTNKNHLVSLSITVSSDLRFSKSLCQKCWLRVKTRKTFAFYELD